MNVLPALNPLMALPAVASAAASAIRRASRQVADLDAIPEPAGPPGASQRRGEVLGVLQGARLAAAAPRLASVPRGDGGIVITVPGFGAPEASLLPLRAYLNRIGWDARSWGLGTNRGRPETDVPKLADRVAEFVEETGEPVALVGWSLGGVIGREVARQLPREVRHVVTYGTPAIGGPTHTATAGMWGPEECARIAKLMDEIDRETPIRTPITAIFSERDGIVDWRACIDRSSPNVTHYRVGSTHLSLGIDPDVFEIAARALAPVADPVPAAA